MWHYLRCRHCGVVSLHPRPSTREVLDAYDNYLPVKPQEIADWEKMVQPVVDRSADIIEHMTGKSDGRLLDIGCGYGFFLKKMKHNGWDVEGIEVSPFGRKFAQRKLGLCIHSKPLEAITFQENQFDAVTLFYVIEHVQKPLTLLRMVRRVLQPGGVVLVRWPHSTPVVRVLGPFARYCDVYHTPYHLYDFTPAAMQRMMIEAGFKDIHTVIGGYTRPAIKFHRYASIVFSRLAETLYHISGGRFLFPGVSKTTLDRK